MNHIASKPIYDEKVNMRITEVKLSGKTIQTPIKTVEKLNPKGEINEFAPRFNRKNLNEILTGDFGEDIKGNIKGMNNLSRLGNNYMRGLINVMIPTYQDVKISSEEMSKMESLHYSHSDVMVTPRWEGILKANRTDRTDAMIDLTKRYVEGISPNNKSVFGNIPRILSFNDIQRYMEEYYKMGITSFVIDCCNYGFRTHLDVQRDIQKKLFADGYLDESILYSINVKRSTLQKAEIIPADDFLMLGLGIDIVGNMHISPGGGDPELKTAKAFIRENYTYKKSGGLTQREASMMRADSCVAQNVEMNILREKIRENTSLKYLKTKAGAKLNLEDMLRMPSQKNLSMIF